MKKTKFTINLFIPNLLCNSLNQISENVTIEAIIRFRKTKSLITLHQSFPTQIDQDLVKGIHCSFRNDANLNKDTELR